MAQTRSDIRNVAIIAHVDHGKTTLVDGMLKQAKVFRDTANVGERILDSNALERERGITILSKNTAVTWNGIKINIVDTPGHADFGGEVERVLNMVDGALLLVDAVDGPMPQTRFVLRKALELGLRVIVVINKVDRPHARVEEVLNETFDLFIELGATDEQAEFPVVYAVGLEGYAGYTPDEVEDNLAPLFETILKEVPGPQIHPDDPTQLQVTTLEYDNYKGQIGVGRLLSGAMRRGMDVVRLTPQGERQTGKIVYLFTYHNLSKQEVDEVLAGDIVAFGGFEDLGISDTIADPIVEKPLPPISIEEPTVRMTFGVNTSPFAGREGKTGWGTSRRLRQRLVEETRSNVALRVADGESPDRFVVSGRGELHLGILIETMRREGYEFEVSKPEVIYHTDPDTGETLEPIEEVYIEAADEMVGTVVELLGVRRGIMQDMRSQNGTTFLKYLVPTRGLLGFRAHFMRATSGLGQISSLFHGYDSMVGPIPRRQFGSLVAWEAGVAAQYAMTHTQQRGTFFIEPGAEVYEGMVIGEHIRPEDLAMNVTKTKQLSAIHTKYYGEELRLNPPRQMSLDDAIEFLSEDELLEVTPQSLRIRKRILNNEDRMKEQKRREKLIEGAG
ncbi:MAG TPA: translational GTPase TypA [Aggregatilinea sp.]|uniref:translational GTPase TypA n=1 Tax=Aggregatilinea sp. TaxID=2806333 RepID=UPI002CD553E4|nr:translational GTPase TypA [Aggregatilinea sp.]HML24675.1 translational GTPase TypA [Aggregatilinea sp.]